MRSANPNLHITRRFFSASTKNFTTCSLYMKINHVKIFSGASITVGGCPSDTADSVLLKILQQEGVIPMLTLEGLISVLGLVLTAVALGFAIGYAFGQNHAKK